MDGGDSTRLNFPKTYPKALYLIATNQLSPTNLTALNLPTTAAR